MKRKKNRENERCSLTFKEILDKPSQTNQDI